MDLKNEEQAPKSTWYGSLRFRLTFILITLAVALSTSTLAMLWFQARPLLEKENFEINRLVGENILSSLGQQIRQVEAITSQLAVVGESLGADETKIKSIVPTLLNYHDLKQVIAGGGVWPQPFKFNPTLERNSYFWGRNTDGSLTFYNDYNLPKGAGYHNEEWYTPSKITQSKAPYWSRSYIDPYSLQPMVTCTASMFREDTFIGVATIDLMLEGVADLVKEKTEPYGGYAFLVDRNNKFISFPHPDSVRTKRSADQKNVTEALTATEFSNSWAAFKPIADKLTNIKQQLFEEAITEKNLLEKTAQSIANDSYQIDSEEALTIAHGYYYNQHDHDDNLEIGRINIPKDVLLNEPATVSFFIVPGTSWTLATIFPLDNTIESANRITRQLSVFSMIFIFICVTAAYLFLKTSLFRRLQLMQTGLKEVSAHESEAISLTGSSNDELGQITYWFNRRTEALSGALSREKLNGDRLIEENITQKRTAKLLRVSNATNQAILDNANLAILTTDARGNIETSSRGTESLLGYEKTHILGKRFDDAILIKHYHGPDSAPFDSFSELIASDRRDKHQKLYGLCQLYKGGWLDTSIEISSIRESSETSGFVIIITDISQQKAVENELITAKVLAEKHNQAKSNFLANMSHELRTPMNAIIGFTVRLEKSLKGEISDRHMDVLGTIHRSANHLLALINDLLDISKIEEGRFELIPSKFDLNQLIHEVHDQTLSLIPANDKVAYTITIPDERFMIYADRKQITQVLYNLTSNAIKATEEGSVNITTKSGNSDHFSIVVSDTGQGMSSLQLKHLFEKFSQFETYHLNQKGSGLGLFLTYQFVNMHNGNIDVQSSLDHGTTFTITLPKIHQPHTVERRSN